MASVGLKHAVFSEIDTEVSGSYPTYKTGFVVGSMMEANVSLEYADSELYADDTLIEKDDSFIDGTIDVGIDDISKEASKVWLGGKEVTYGGRSVIEEASNYSAPYGGFGYYRVRKKNGIRLIRAFWYLKTKWKKPSEEAKTKGKTIEFQTPKIQGSIIRIDNEQESWRIWDDFTSEADAKAWIDDIANIGAPADKTSLNAAVTSAQALDPETYTCASWVDVANALAEAVAVQNMDTPSQTHVDSATSLLNTAVGSLVSRS